MAGSLVGVAFCAIVFLLRICVSPPTKQSRVDPFHDSTKHHAHDGLVSYAEEKNFVDEVNGNDPPKIIDIKDVDEFDVRGAADKNMYDRQAEDATPFSEWLVGGSNVSIRHGKSMGAKILGWAPAGTVVVGRIENTSWIKLQGRPGYMPIRNGANMLLSERMTSYVKISSGRCADLGLYSITNTIGCEAAARSLGLDDSTVQVVKWKVNVALPEGCYFRSGGGPQGDSHLFMSTDQFKGNGAAEGREPICATELYPTTTTTSITTTQTLTNTSTTSMTTRTTQTWTEGFPSLLCFAVMRAYTNEEALIKRQCKEGIGIFACDETIVISQEEVVVGKNRTGGNVVTWVNPAPALPMGNMGAGATTNSWLNTAVFINAFDTILNAPSKTAFKHDWLVKVDPDAVLFPDRLRLHLKSHTPGSFYLTNCNVGGAKLYGALEVYSREAVENYKTNAWKCKQMPWHGWGEDSYFQKCMDALGVSMIADFMLVGDQRCMFAPCSDPWRAAFHPFKDEGSWWNCYKQSTGR